MSKNPLIFDCFTFFNEFDLLEIRLKYLYDHVDHFVIVESDTTHNGESKAFNFLDQESRYLPFQDKITFIPSKMPSFPNSRSVAWKRENYQRDEIKKGLKELNVHSEDIILLSDLDEIVNVEVIKKLRDGDLEQAVIKDRYFLIKEVISGFFGLIGDLINRKVDNRLRMRQGVTGLRNFDLIPTLLLLDNFYYFVNNRHKRRNVWKGTICLKFDVLDEYTLSELRELRRFPVKHIPDSGWHFSYLGGIEKVKHKLRNFAHQEFNLDELVNDEYINFCIENGYSLFSYFKDKNLPPEFDRIEASEFPEGFRDIISSYPQLFYK